MYAVSSWDYCIYTIVYHNRSYETTCLFDWSSSVSVVVVWLSNITDMCNKCCCHTWQIDYPGSYRDASMVLYVGVGELSLQSRWKQGGKLAGLEICSQHGQLSCLKVVFMHVFANHESKNYFISPPLDSFSSRRNGLVELAVELDKAAI
jgi:hypothetical protein